MAAVPSLALACLVGLAVGFGSISFLTASTAIAQLRADPSMRGRVLALQAMVFLGSTPIGGPLVGWVCESFGARWGIVVGAASCVAAGGWGLLMARRTDEGGPAARTVVVEPDVVPTGAVGPRPASG
jgi:MFS family permease